MHWPSSSSLMKRAHLMTPGNHFPEIYYGSHPFFGLSVVKHNPHLSGNLPRLFPPSHAPLRLSRLSVCHSGAVQGHNVYGVGSGVLGKAPLVGFYSDLRTLMYRCNIAHWLKVFQVDIIAMRRYQSMGNDWLVARHLGVIPKLFTLMKLQND